MIEQQHKDVVLRFFCSVVFVVVVVMVAAVHQSFKGLRAGNAVIGEWLSLPLVPVDAFFNDDTTIVVLLDGKGCYGFDRKEYNNP